MFTRFESNFRPDCPAQAPPASEFEGLASTAELFEFLSRFGGKSFRNGLYRVMDQSITRLAAAFIEAAFPKFAGNTQPFAYDWLGRIFALDSNRAEGELRAVTMFEPGTNEALAIPCDLVSFHESELIDYTEASLAISFYEQWLASGGEAPTRDQCIGYRVPLFIGGKDEVVNLGISDLDVYWSLTGELVRKMRDLSPGTAHPKFSPER